MAGLFFVADSGLVASPAAGVNLTLMQLVPPANQRLVVHHFVFSGDGVTATDDSIACEALTQTTAGTSASLTLNKWNETDTETIQSTALQTFTGEPTPGTVKSAGHINEQGDRYEWGYPQNPNPIKVKGGNRLGFRVRPGTTITPATTKFRVIALCEE